MDTLIKIRMSFNFDTSYTSLPSKLYAEATPTPVKNPKIVLWNQSLANQLHLNSLQPQDADTIYYLSGNKIIPNSKPIAQAYAGHQFGHFTMLGDGRAILLGEHITPDNKRYDIQLKGAGPTPYSRRGDGRATLRSMLREYLISEAMFSLGIPTSRSLAVVSCDDKVYRQDIHTGAILTRILQSHIRVGTFEYVNQYCSKEELQTFTNYVIKRHYPYILECENPILEFIKNFVQNQLDLIVHWMRVGFIHGVMNTDNTSIAPETFDYGPCSFMNTYHPNTVFSSIDVNGRYAYKNQPTIIQWNIAVFIETLLPLLHTDSTTALELGKEIVYSLNSIYLQKYYAMMFQKIGIVDGTPEDQILVDELLDWMVKNKADFTTTFFNLSYNFLNPFKEESIQPWLTKWKQRIGKDTTELIRIMQNVNPVFIPRNELVEEALDLAEENNYKAYHTLLEVIQKPYQPNEKHHEKYNSFSKDYDSDYKTYCGT